MGTPFSPTPEDVGRYRRFRALSVALSARLIKTIPPQAYADVGNALGIRHKGVLLFDNEDVTSVLMDCCLYDWYENGKNLMQRYVEANPPEPGSDEDCLLHAYLDADYRVLKVESVVPGAGVHCRDVLNGEELFMMDIGFSRTLRGGAAVATRTIPLGEFWIAGGAALPIDPDTDFEGALRRIASSYTKPLEDSAVLTLAIVRACLRAGAADRIMYASPEEQRAFLEHCAAPRPAPRRRRRHSRGPDFKRRRRY